ncbi:MAG TPA: 3-deoxy-manno-octulosonate cytidylyltransferase [Phycisphaerales bacterium]|nr:3-deoxy-manno-octulosonate cytidylyltransferase [Phycisphaerales bacterium]HIB01815.1 3-deoxy-manno-octulosonate cytidylyltransferase [Phycisphaerales bacterium]HIB50613.1 3-deoxy-manno-octulosonate cytidylyltransferase [Phycisphaerales bacterium]HIO20347.1 3-deoxy-manno-octulosonate cytidylyltransferase [Phycisphaerales bacterium]
MYAPSSSRIYNARMDKKVVAVIPARIDSSRFPAKMIADASGKPLIQYAWEVAKKAQSVTEVYIATDSEEIASRVRAFGGEVIMTGIHPNGTSRIAQAVQDLECDLVVNMQGDEPELDSTVIDKTVEIIGDSVMATAACALQSDEIENVNVVKTKVEGDFAIDFSRFAENASLRHIGLYVYQPSFLQTYVAMQPTQNEIGRKLEQMRAIDNGYSIAVAIVEPQPGGIDTKEQYEEFVARRS